MNPNSRRTGFTLLELLVTIGIAGVLLGITLPVLRVSRGRAQSVAELSHQRQAGFAVIAYADDNGGAFPYFGIPGTDFAPFKYIDGPLKGQWFGNEYGWHWEQVWAWAYWLKGLGYESADNAITFSTGERQVVEPSTGYGRAVDVMTNAAFARPVFFAENGPRRIEDHQGQHIQHVAFPSKKGVLRRQNWVLYRTMDRDDVNARIDQLPVYIWFADGHSGMHAPNAMRPGLMVSLSDVWTPPVGPVHATVDGIMGRDL